MREPAIRVRNVGKEYRVGALRSAGRSFGETLSDAALAPYRRLRAVARGHASADRDESFWALRGVTFDVAPGEVVGVIGRNGAGKSTLLKLISRITEPTTGSLEIRGNVGSLLEVGTGFHPELTGRENIYLNGTILGMRKREIDQRFEEIVRFSGVERFLETPVKRYSSGMYLRLAFAVAAHLNPDILLIDEVLAVGDSEFRRKCVGKMNSVAREGRTVLVVSHELGLVRSLCGRGILMDEGKVVADGDVDAVIQQYVSAGGENGRAHVLFAENTDIPLQIREVRITDESGESKREFDVFDQVVAEVSFDVRTRLEGSNILVGLSKDGVELFTSFDTDQDPETFRSRAPGTYTARVTLPSPLKAGRYGVNVGTGIISRGPIETTREALSFIVEERSFDPSFVGYAQRRPGLIVGDVRWTKRAQGPIAEAIK